MAEIQHGTATAYTYHRCHCEECRSEMARIGRESRARRAEQGLTAGDKRHGTRNGYVNYGCRCGECTVAMTGGKFAVREAGFGHEVYIRELGGWFVVGEKVD